MLTQEDLKKIGEVVDEKLELHTETILSVVKKGFDGVDERFEVMELRMDKKMDVKLAVQKHELMDHTDRTVARAVGDLRSELRERRVSA